MKKFLIAASAAAAALAVAPASAAPTFDISGGLDLAVPANNDFRFQLAALGYVRESVGGTISIGGGDPAWIDFFVMGTESGYKDTFTYGDVSYTEDTTVATSYFPDGIFIGSVLVTGTSFDGVFSAVPGAPYTQVAGSGSNGFAIFRKAGDGMTFSAGEIYFGYDDIPDIPNPADDNHDDLIIRAVIRAVPEPTTWALMVAGIGAVGFSMRRRSSNVRIAFS